MGIATDYYLGFGAECRKAEPEAPKPFDMEKVGKAIAKSTHHAVSKVLSFKAYDDAKISTESLGEKLSKSKCGFVVAVNQETDPTKYIEGVRFATLLGKIINAIEKYEGDFEIDDVHSLRKDIRAALKLIENNPGLFESRPYFAQFLQALCYQIKTQVEGMSILESMGEQALAWCKNPITKNNETVTASQLADYAEEAFDRMPEFDWNGIGWLKWAMCNPREAFFAGLDNNTTWGHKYYNSYDQGNVDITYGHYEIDEDDEIKRIQMSVGAGLMNDPAISEAAMKWVQLKGEIQVAHTMEFNEQKGEKTRLVMLKNLINKINGIVTEFAMFVVYLVATTQNGKIEQGKEEFSEIKSVADFHEKLKALDLAKRKKIEDVTKFNGICLPEPLLKDDDRDIDKVIEFSQNALIAASGDQNLNPNSDRKINRQLCSAMLANFNAFLEVKMLVNLGKLLAERKITQAQYSIVCKQCFDRGPLANAILMAYAKLIEKGNFNGKDAKQILGFLTGRTMMGDGDRKMVKNRRQTFIDLFNLIGKNETGFVKQLRKVAPPRREGIPSIRFVPSNEPTSSIPPSEETNRASQTILA